MIYICINGKHQNFLIEEKSHPHMAVLEYKMKFQIN